MGYPRPSCKGVRNQFRQGSKDLTIFNILRLAWLRRILCVGIIVNHISDHEIVHNYITCLAEGRP
jgi:hypothetical protein